MRVPASVLAAPVYEPAAAPRSADLSNAACAAIRAEDGPVFNNAWREVVFIHYRVNPAALQAQVPFELDLRAGQAYVSLVAFTLHDLRPFRPSTLWRMALIPMRTLIFLNLRTYVRCGNEAGIYFLAEWLPSRLAVYCGRHTFGLPYRYGQLRYHTQAGRFTGMVREGRSGPALRFEARPLASASPAPAPPGSLDAFLVERYVAFTRWGRRLRRFRIWHEPWPLLPARLDVCADALLKTTGPWFDAAQRLHAAYSRGLDEVWIGRPQRIVPAFRE